LLVVAMSAVASIAQVKHGLADRAGLRGRPRMVMAARQPPAAQVAAEMSMAVLKPWPNAPGFW
jgi:hypothetical protein